ncbi:hypothetical protein CCACVL1_17934 [Corchorus capsularis]|uniref:Uncharacterized protein n=1 Tax=Corchorus capsularis TaxID=210143 RepID=A0A1R3HP67_COCAP|nr:hypothetical protein CCACVL1_17934 [Corchorus capsularis]
MEDMFASLELANNVLTLELHQANGTDFLGFPEFQIFESRHRKANVNVAAIANLIVASIPWEDEAKY